MTLSLMPFLASISALADDARSAAEECLSIDSSWLLRAQALPRAETQNATTHFAEDAPIFTAFPS